MLYTAGGFSLPFFVLGSCILVLSVVALKLLRSERNSSNLSTLIEEHQGGDEPNVQITFRKVLTVSQIVQGNSFIRTCCDLYKIYHAVICLHEPIFGQLTGKLWNDFCGINAWTPHGFRTHQCKSWTSGFDISSGRCSIYGCFTHWWPGKLIPFKVPCGHCLWPH